MSQPIIKCSQCINTYESYLTKHGKISKVCPRCRENQIRADAKRKDRVRNYRAEGKRNLEVVWNSFKKKTVEVRNKEISISKEQFLELIQKPCYYCNYYNEEEINGIDRVDNNKDYIIENCITACKDCNRMKHILHPVFFLNKTKIITKHQENILNSIERELFYDNWDIYVHKIPTYYVYIKRISEERRGLEFTITKDEYSSLIKKKCYLCGYINSAGNGLDRQDNTKGYTLENVKTCCSTCNMMKAFYTTTDFIKQMKKISEFKEDYPDEWDLIPCNGFRMGASKMKT